MCPHRCEKSSRKCPYVESTSGDQGVKELNDSGTPVKYLEGMEKIHLLLGSRVIWTYPWRKDSTEITLSRTLVKACLRCKKKNLVSRWLCIFKNVKFSKVHICRQLGKQSWHGREFGSTYPLSIWWSFPL